MEVVGPNPKWVRAQSHDAQRSSSSRGQARRESGSKAERGRSTPARHRKCSEMDQATSSRAQMMKNTNPQITAHAHPTLSDLNPGGAESRMQVIRGGIATNLQHVLAIKALSASAKMDMGYDDSVAGSSEKLMDGDIVEEVRMAGGVHAVAMKSGQLQREMRRCFDMGETLVEVLVRRLPRSTAMPVSAVIVATDESIMRNLKKKSRQYALRALNDGSHVVTFVDSTEEACIGLQEARCARMTSQYPVKDGYIPYDWDKKAQLLFPCNQHESSRPLVFSLVVVPFAVRGRSPACSYSTVADTIARAMTWLMASQASGIPICFLGIQTEPLLTKVNGHESSKCTVSANLRDDLSSIINTGIYGFEDYHGIDIGVLRGVRLWYAPTTQERHVSLQAYDTETRFGIGISQTDEGFCCISTVEIDSAADRAGLKAMLRTAKRAAQLLMITRVEGERITPSMVSSSGSVRCYDTKSISQKFAMHRSAGRTLCFSVLSSKEGSQQGSAPSEEASVDRVESFSFRVV